MFTPPISTTPVPTTPISVSRIPMPPAPKRHPPTTARKARACRQAPGGRGQAGAGFAMALGLVLAGCAVPGSDAGTNSASFSASAASSAPSAPLWDSDGLSAQPRLSAHIERLPEGLGFSPGTTEWEASDMPLPATKDSPAALLAALVAEQERLSPLGEGHWEQTQRLQRNGEAAVGVVLMWGFKDDAVLGQDYRLTMHEEADGWHAEYLEVRYHCGRGVGDEGLCL